MVWEEAPWHGVVRMLEMLRRHEGLWAEAHLVEEEVA